MSGNVSTIKRLDPRLKEAVDEAIRDGRATISEIVELIRAMGGDVSRSAVGRYKQSAEKAMETYRAAQAMAAVWATKIKDDPESDIARLAASVLGSVAFNTVNEALNSGEAMPPGELMLAAKALDHLGRFNKSTLDTVVKARREFAAEAAVAVEQVARQQGVSREGINALREALTQAVA
jgi:hypothetical protein